MKAIDCGCPACRQALSTSLDRYQRAHIANELRAVIVRAVLHGQDVEPLAVRLRDLACLGWRAA